MKNSINQEIDYFTAFDKLLNIINHPKNEKIHLPSIKRAIQNFHTKYDNYRFSLYHAELLSEYYKLEKQLK